MDIEVGREHLPSLHEPRHAVRHEYQRRLDDVDDELIGAALRVADALPSVMGGFLAADRACAEEGRALSAEVAQRCRTVEDEGFLLLALEAPVAGDLRRLVAILRLAYSVERAAALLRHVAEALEGFDPRRLPDDMRRQVEELGIRASEVFRRGVDAWRRRDGLAVHELDELDGGIDALRAGLVDRAGQELEASDVSVIGLLGRYLERIGDHGVSFARHSTFAVTGERVGR